MAGNSANTDNSGIIKYLRNRVLPCFTCSALIFSGCTFSFVTPIDSYKTEIREEGLVNAYNQDAENHIKNKEYLSAWDNYVITGNIQGLEIILNEYFKDVAAHDKIIIEPINQDLMAMHRELRKKNCQMEDFENKVEHNALIYEDPSNSHGSLEKAFIFYEIIERHSDAERCLILWINRDNNNRHDTARIMKYCKKFSKETDLSNLKNEALKRADYYLNKKPPTMDACESAWIIGDAFDNMEIKKKAIELGIVFDRRNNVWNKRALKIQEILDKEEIKNTLSEISEDGK